MEGGRHFPPGQVVKEVVVLPVPDPLGRHPVLVLEEAVAGQGVLEDVDLAGPPEGALVLGLEEVELPRVHGGVLQVGKGDGEGQVDGVLQRLVALKRHNLKKNAVDHAIDQEKK